MLVLLTAVAYQSYGAMLARPQLQWLLMGEDGSIRDPDGEKITNENAQPDIAWSTSDLFREGAPLAPFFFFFMLSSPGLRWFQSPAAGYETPVFTELVANGVRVTNAHVNSLPIAEYVLRAVLDEFQGAAHWRDQASEHR